MIYKVDPGTTHRGVQIQENFFPGYPLGADREDTYISYIGLPYMTASLAGTVITATDEAGNIAEKRISPVLQKPNQKNDKIYVGDGFLEKKIQEFGTYYPDLSGDNLEKYITINRKVRKENNNKIKEICTKSNPQRLWEGSFSRMAGAFKAGFADHRTYLL